MLHKIMDLAYLRRVAGVVSGLNIAGFAITSVFETHKITDLVGCGAFGAARYREAGAASGQ